ncbi:hypothetical protein BKA64DRAFT_686627 [Cadophora sp. MPI-SDFR-AT-0126]|nr:hypothetical protein BKA64DRAFT_686627 [Leotiomycetes sp. MPI-SDFR-AT-0126]
MKPNRRSWTPRRRFQFGLVSSGRDTSNPTPKTAQHQTEKCPDDHLLLPSIVRWRTSWRVSSPSCLHYYYSVSSSETRFSSSEFVSMCGGPVAMMSVCCVDMTICDPSACSIARFGVRSVDQTVLQRMCVCVCVWNSNRGLCDCKKAEICPVACTVLLHYPYAMHACFIYRRIRFCFFPKTKTSNLVCNSIDRQCISKIKGVTSSFGWLFYFDCFVAGIRIRKTLKFPELE